MLYCRAFITETLIPPKDEDDTVEGNDKSDFRDFVSNWLDKFRGNKTEMDKVWLPVMLAEEHPQVFASLLDLLCSHVCSKSVHTCTTSFELMSAAEQRGVPWTPELPI